MTNSDCEMCRNQYASGCPGCTEVAAERQTLNNPEYDALMDEVHREMYKQDTDYDYFPGCYEG